MPSYIAFINQLLVAEAARLPHAVFFGENLNHGSHLSGLTRNLAPAPGSRLLNVANCEYTHCGLGFGLMLNGATAVLLAKQLDFMLLGVDHFVSTYNAVRSRPDRAGLGSFTLIAVAYDHGFQGPQSSFNALGDLCSLAHVNGYTLTNTQDAARILPQQLREPGFRFIVLSQRLSPREVLPLDLVYAAEDASVLQYTEGADVTIACFNFATPAGWQLQQALAGRGLTASLFSINYTHPCGWQPVLQSAARTGRLVVLDDSASAHLPGYQLLHEAAQQMPAGRTWLVRRAAYTDFRVGPDEFEYDQAALIDALTAARTGRSAGA